MPTRAMGRPQTTPRVVVREPGSPTQVGLACPTCQRPGIAIFGEKPAHAECCWCSHRTAVRGDR